MRDRRRGRCIGGVGGGEGQEKGTVYWRGGGRGGKMGEWKRGRGCMFNNSHNICRSEEGVGVGKGWE